MRRTLEHYLENWLIDKCRKPLIIYGARQVGKTYLVDEIFKNKHFDNKHYIHIDFKFDHESRRYIKNHIDSDEIIEYLALKKNININEETLIFFDEIQECLPVITSLKSFYEKHSELTVIATGSLVRTKIKQMETSKKIALDPEIDREHQDGHNNYMFPLGKIDECYLYPMNFNEFLFSVNEQLYSYLENSYKNKTDISNEFHNLALKYVNDYLLIGGLPENIKIYLETGSYERSRNNLITLYNNYLNDMVLYQVSETTILRSRNIFNSIYSQLTKENKNFKISNIEEQKKFRDYETPFFWLDQANLIYPSYQIKQRVTLPLSKEESSLFRIYMPDSGLLAYQSGISAENFINDITASNISGIFYENFVACELRCRNKPLFYWKGKTSSELEFIIQKNDSIIPIDVKKNVGNLKSLAKYREANTKDIAIKISSNKYGYNNESMLYTIPHYFVGFFFDELFNFSNTL